MIDGYYPPEGAHLASKVKPVLVAAGKRTFAAAGTHLVARMLTTAHASPTVTATKRFALTR